MFLSEQLLVFIPSPGRRRGDLSWLSHQPRTELCPPAVSDPSGVGAFAPGQGEPEKLPRSSDGGEEGDAGLGDDSSPGRGWP